MADIHWTPAQTNAIEGTGGNILVSAAAGSGKTAVLAQRVLQMITEGNPPVDIDRLLVVTFSNAAAGEMKQRIAKKLWELGREQPGNSRLVRQQLLLDSARISTIHSFCISLLRANFHLIGLPADFRIGDERELDVLRMQTVRRVIAARYDTADEVFIDLVEMISNTRSDNKLWQSVLRLYEFLRNHPFYEEWLDRVARSYSAAQPVEQSPWFAIIMDYAVDAVDYAVKMTQSVLDELAADEQLMNAYGAAFANDLSQLCRCRKQLEGCDWDEARQAVASVAFGTLGRLSGYPDEGKKKRVQDTRKSIKTIITNLQQKQLAQSAQDYLDDMARLAPVVDELFDIVLEFDRELSEAKLAKNLLDFGDLEHYTLKLLYDSSHGVHTPSAVALELRRQYHEILIDEYQDTNGTQEMIFKALEREDGNRFLVGDVKQSIYRFRQARPENFLEKKLEYAPFDGSTFPARISLSQNFRTRQETTELINFIFRLVMSRKIGEMEYLPEDALYASGDYDYSVNIPVQLMVTDPSLRPDEDNTMLEAGMVADEIKRLIDMGIAAPKQICILLRSPSNKAQRYIDALGERGIRAWSDRQEGFLDTREIAPIVSYLKVLANPMLDLELGKVLVSYFYGYTSDMLAQLRLAGGDSLFASLLMKRDSDPAANSFLEDFALLRRESACRPASGVLALLYTITSAEHKSLAMTQGRTRRANLRLLSEYASSYGNGADFSGFLGYLYALEEYECDLPSATTSAGDCVSIMSIHKSKGLEFPVVFLSNTATQFNTTDLIDQIQLHPELGFSCLLRDNRKMTQHRTIPLEAMALENKRALLSEELRVLYVALTRARERLYITAADNKLAKLASAVAAPLEGGRLSAWTVRSAGSFFDWIAAALCRHPDFPDDLLDSLPQTLTRAGGQGSLAVKLCQSETVNSVPETGGGEAPIADVGTVRLIRERMHWEYPYHSDTVTPVKLSVSQLTKEKGNGYFFVRRPRLLTGKGLTPAERGIAAHKFMQFADYPAAAADPVAELRRLTDSGFLTPEEGEHVEVGAIERLFASDIGVRLATATSIEREIRFMREFTPAELSLVLPGSEIAGRTVVQGVADCVIIENGIGTVVDYKTDRVQSMQQLAEMYSDQLRLYRHILEGLLEVSIEHCILYSFVLGQEITVQNNP